jgi:hypothetical protein
VWNRGIESLQVVCDRLRRRPIGGDEHRLFTVGQHDGNPDRTIGPSFWELPILPVLTFTRSENHGQQQGIASSIQGIGGRGNVLLMHFSQTPSDSCFMPQPQPGCTVCNGSLAPSLHDNNCPTCHVAVCDDCFPRCACPPRLKAHSLALLMRRRVRSLGDEIDALQASAIASKWHQERLELVQMARARYMGELLKYSKTLGTHFPHENKSRITKPLTGRKG